MYIIILFLLIILLITPLAGAAEEQYRIHRWFHQDPIHGKSILGYILNRCDRRDYLKKLIYGKLQKKISDRLVFKIFKKYIKPKEDSLASALNNKINMVKAYCTVDPPGPILDVGTEELKFLDMLGDIFNQPAYGINVRNDYQHYDKNYENLDSNSKFQFYDGINIPYPDEFFGMVTMFSVAHHIPPAVLQKLLVQIVRVLKPGGYFFIKENNLVYQKFRDGFNIQHEIFEGALYPGRPYYKNDKMKIADIKHPKLEYINSVDLHNFTAVTFCTFRRLSSYL